MALTLDVIKNKYGAENNKLAATNVSTFLKNSAENKLPTTTYKSLKNITSNQNNNNYQEPKTSGNALVRTYGTMVDLVQNIQSGLVGSVEGVVDLAAGLVGSVAGLFGADGTQNKIKKFQQKDYSSKIVDAIGKYNPAAVLPNALAKGLATGNYNPFEDGSNYNVKYESFLYDAPQKAQNVVRGIANGVGQVVFMAATAGIGGAVSGASKAGAISTATQAANYSAKAARVTSLISIGSSASGRAMVDALDEGASYNKALGYGLVSGASEVAIESVSGGVGKVLGRGISTIPGVKTAGAKVASTVGGKILDVALGGASEGLEEVISEYTNPALKKIFYKDKYEKPELNQVMESFIIGSSVGALVGTVSLKKQAVNSVETPESKQQVSNLVDKLETIKTEESNLKNNNQLTEETKQKIETQKIELVEELGQILKENDIKTEVKTNNIENDGNLLKEQYQAVDNQNQVFESGDIKQPVKIKESKFMKEFSSNNEGKYSKDFLADVEKSKLHSVVNTNYEAKSTVEKLKSQNLDYDKIQEKAHEFITNYQQKKKISKNDLYQADYIMTELANTYKDTRLAQDVLETMSMVGTDYGRVIQAYSMFKYLTPKTRERLVKKQLSKVNENAKKRNPKLDQNIVDQRKKTYYKQDLELIKKDALDSALNGKEISENTKKKVYDLDYDVENTQISNTLNDLLKNEIKNTNSRKSVINKLIDKVQTEQKTLDNDYNNEHVILPRTLIEKVQDANTKEKRLEVEKEVKKVFNEQWQATKWEKLEAFRTLSMLFNAKTHGRNFVGNAILYEVSKVKNIFNAVIEKVIIKDPNMRTRTNTRVSTEMKTYSKELFSEDLFNEYKYEVEKRQVFTSKALKPIESLRKWNMNMLEKADAFFMKKIFSDTFGKWATAKNLTVNEIKTNETLLNEGIEFAVREANINTFKEFSWLANKINEIKTCKSLIARIFVGGAMPFTKTPINVARVGFRYSPAGLMKTLSYDTYQLKKGKININQYIDNISQGMTGSAVAGIGFLLASLGLLGIGDDDNYDYKKTTGKQNYALNVGGMSFTLSWVSPSAIPLFTGVALYESLGKESDSMVDAIGKSLFQLTDPLTEMSMLSSLNDILSTYKSDNALGPLGSIGLNAAKNYTTSFIPTISSQIAKIIDPYQRTSVATKNNSVGSKDIQKYFNTLIAKVPGFSLLLEPYVDVWGNEVKNYNGFATGITNALEQSVSPGWWASDTTDFVDDEISRLLTITGDNSIVPKLPSSYYTIDGVKYHLTSKEYTQYKKVVGSNSKKTLKNIIKSSWYKNLNVEQQANLIAKVYTMSKDYAKKTGKFENQAVYKEFAFEEFMTHYLYISNSIFADENSTKKENTYRYVNSLSLSRNQKNALLDSFGY